MGSESDFTCGTWISCRLYIIINGSSHTNNRAEFMDVAANVLPLDIGHRPPMHITSEPIEISCLTTICSSIRLVHPCAKPNSLGGLVISPS